MRKIFSILSLLGIVTLFLLSHVQAASAQITTRPTPTPLDKNDFRIAMTLFGVKNDTGNIFSFVKVNNLTTSKFIDSVREDSDHDGILDTALRLPNQTVSTGANFTACSVVLKYVSMSCKSGIHIQGRTGSVQIVLPTFHR
jgi:hypothetical protein